ncbi:MAG: MFS transporter [Bacteroidales bacterium]|nr:MFS transporter [Bacteroidales bacterium]MCF8387377.1 MFS transporter [Bacteroidales bacterium]MCF8399596.1 MFS transporter [Bacteroidales bacterium]
MAGKFRTPQVLSISITHLLHDIYTSFLAPILPLLIEKLGFSLSLAGLLSLIQRIPSLFNPLIGIMADKVAVRYFVILSPSITAISMSLLGVATSYTFLAILLFISGISSAVFHVPAPVLVKNVSGKRIGTGMSFYMVGGELARTLGPIVILASISYWGLEGSWRLLFFAVAATLFLFFMLRNVDSDVEIKKKKQEQKNESIWQYMKSIQMIIIAVSGITFFRAMMKSALTAFLPTFINSQGESLWFAGISLTVLQFAGAASVMTAGTVSDKIGRINMLKIATIASPVFMWLFVYLGKAFIFPVLILLGLSIFASTPVLLAFLQEIGKDRPAFINSIYMTVGFVSGAVAVVLVGALGDVIGLKHTFEITAYIGIAAIPFVFLLDKKIK